MWSKGAKREKGDRAYGALWPSKGYGPVALKGLWACGPQRATGLWPSQGYGPVALKGLWVCGPERAMSPWPSKGYGPVALKGPVAIGPHRAYGPVGLTGPVAPLEPMGHGRSLCCHAAPARTLRTTGQRPGAHISRGSAGATAHLGLSYAISDRGTGPQGHRAMGATGPSGPSGYRAMGPQGHGATGPWGHRATRPWGHRAMGAQGHGATGLWRHRASSMTLIVELCVRNLVISL